MFGSSPLQDDDTIIPIHLLEDAIKREVEPQEVQPIWGIDISRFGSDRSALAKRKGNVLLEQIKNWSQKDLMETVSIILAEYESVPYDQRPSDILIDSKGLGSGVVDRLIELDLPARGVNIVESPALGQPYMKLRDELWFRAK